MKELWLLYDRADLDFAIFDNTATLGAVMSDLYDVEPSGGSVPGYDTYDDRFAVERIPVNPTPAQYREHYSASFKQS